jgi:hypothetical protein
MPPRRFALAAIVLALALVASAYGAAFRTAGPPRWAPWAMAGGTVLLHVGLFVLGAARRDRLPPLLWGIFAVTGVVCLAGFGVALIAPPAADPLLFGLPRRTALLLAAVGMLPFVLLPLAYAATFDTHGLDERTLAEVRAAAARTTGRVAGDEAAP